METISQRHDHLSFISAFESGNCEEEGGKIQRLNISREKELFE